MIPTLLISPALAGTLAACGPISPDLAAKQCEEQARSAAGPTGQIGIGVNSDGRATNSIEIGISSDFLIGKDPQQVYESCVRRKAGEAPIRPLEL